MPESRIVVTFQNILVNSTINSTSSLDKLETLWEVDFKYVRVVFESSRNLFLKLLFELTHGFIELLKRLDFVIARLYFRRDKIVV